MEEALWGSRRDQSTAGSTTVLLQSVLRWESRFSSLLPPLGTMQSPELPSLYRAPCPPQRQLYRGSGVPSKPVPKGKESGGWVDWGFGINRGTLLYIYKITRTYCRAQGTVLQYPVRTYNGKESRKEIPLKLKQHT